MIVGMEVILIWSAISALLTPLIGDFIHGISQR
jgi:hypothetical protein